MVPPSSSSSDTLAFISGLFAFIDSLTKVHLRPETKTKLRKIREDLDKELKADAEKDKKEEVCMCIYEKQPFHWLFFPPSWNKQYKIVRPRRSELRRKEYPSSVLQNSARSVHLQITTWSFLTFSNSISRRRRKSRWGKFKVASSRNELAIQHRWWLEMINWTTRDYISDTLLPIKYNNPK